MIFGRVSANIEFYFIYSSKEGVGGHVCIAFLIRAF